MDHRYLNAAACWFTKKETPVTRIMIEQAGSETIAADSTKYQSWGGAKLPAMPAAGGRDGGHWRHRGGKPLFTIKAVRHY
jgi:hypothetical protein